jgi:transcriptional regulator with XRE-family HTH domain
MQTESSPYAEIGAKLREARKDMHLTTLQAAQAMHIRAQYVEALESGRFEALPGLAYAKGYLQSYAAFLQLDKDAMLHQFEQVEAALKKGFYLPQGISREKTPTNSMVWGGPLAALLAFLVWIVANHSEKVTVSVVDAVPKQVYARPEYFYNPACFRAKAELYPPCYEIWVEETPRTRPIKSIMDLALKP